MSKLMNRNKNKTLPEQGLFGEALQQEMEDKMISIQVFSEKIGVTYEHVRRLIKSMAFPSKPLMGMMAHTLGWNKERIQEMQSMVLKDRLKHKYADLPQAIYGGDKNPKYERTERNLRKLNDAQFRMISNMIEAAAKSAQA